MKDVFQQERNLLEAENWAHALSDNGPKDEEEDEEDDDEDDDDDED